MENICPGLIWVYTVCSDLSVPIIRFFWYIMSVYLPVCQIKIQRVGSLIHLIEDYYFIHLFHTIMWKYSITFDKKKQQKTSFVYFQETKYNHMVMYLYIKFSLWMFLHN